MIIDTGCDVGDKLFFRVAANGEARVGVIAEIRSQIEVVLTDELDHSYAVPLDQVLTLPQIVTHIADLQAGLDKIKIK